MHECLHLKKKIKKGQAYCYCDYKHSNIEFSSCFNCLNKEYKKDTKNTLKTPNITCLTLKQKTPLNKISKTNKLTKATAIPKNVKLKVWERDLHKCIFCHKTVTWYYSNSHYIKRSHLGLGIEENIFTVCPTCHHEFDDTPKRKYMLPIAKKYLMSKYDYWNEEILIYKKWSF